MPLSSLPGVLALALAEAFTPLLAPLSLGAVLGYAAGYALRAAYRLALLGLGLILILLQLLSYEGLISIHWPQIEALSTPWLSSAQRAWPWISGVLTHDLPFGGAFVAGLFLGLRRR